MAEEKLTAKQETFVQEYLTDLNATQAAIRAGYSPRTAKHTGCRILQKPDVARIIAEARRKREIRTGITQDRILERLAEIAFGEGHKDSDALRALEFCGKHLGMFKDKLELTGKDGGAVSLSMPERTRRLSFLLAEAQKRSP